MHVILALSLSPTGDWTEAAAIMTFAIPVGIFVVVATWLYFLYTRPHAVPGHRDLVPARRPRRARGRRATACRAPAAASGTAATTGRAAGWRLPAGRRGAGLGRDAGTA